MDKLVKIFKNVWFRRGLAMLCWVYTGIMIWVAFLSFEYYFEFNNPRPLFVLYLFVNVAALGLMILSRKQVITQINAYILPLAVFALVIFGFGNWYMIVPPVAVTIVLFFVNGSNETLKTVVGTMYLLMYVIGVVGYIAAQMFMGTISFTGVDLNTRDKNYEKLSPSGEYRIVRYFEEYGEITRQSYYIESTADDIKIPLGTCKRVYGSYHLNTAEYSGTPEDLDDWTTQVVDGQKVDMPVVEGIVVENPYLIKDIDSIDTKNPGTVSTDESDESVEDSEGQDESSEDSESEE